MGRGESLTVSEAKWLESFDTFVGTDPQPIETKQSILESGHKSCASRMAKIVGLLATIAPSCQRYIPVA